MNDGPASTRTAVIRGAGDAADLIDTLKRLNGRTNWIWFLALAGLFLDAYSNAALGAGLSPMVKELGLSPTQVGVLTAMAPAIAIVSNPFGGWLAARIGRVKPLLLTKVVFAAGALITAAGSDFQTVFAGRALVGVAYGIDFAVAMALLAEYTPASLKGRLNFWQGVWYTATTTNLLLTLLFYKSGVGAGIWRWSVGSAAAFAVVLLALQLAFLVESPTWLASKGRLREAAANLRRMYGLAAQEGPPLTAAAGESPRQVGLGDAAVLFRRPYLPRTVLSTAISLTQAMQYFAVGWYLPVISLELFGKEFEKATLGSMAFNAVGIVGGCLSAYAGRRLGLRVSSMAGYAVVFVALLVMGATFKELPVGLAALLPVLFIFFHSAGPGPNGKSIAALSYRSDIRTLGTGVTGMLGSLGSVAGLYLFPQLQAGLGVGASLMVLSVVPLAGLLTCLAIRWDPTRVAVNLEEEAVGLPSRQPVSA
ncbi:MFS transporter [Nonomuraea roseoviolacea subsp. roseoviolacea]|uniref:MFS family permease n=3 Tax=Nonomuraea TaxID=83681 RepID=A0ABT1KD57_9ACTN|nr:MFS transporter [Nonomuraea roseoviolacea]MCP2351597.1 MFS family permease [Nonomuraea roseoviolacea subsp. carminata]